MNWEEEYKKCKEDEAYFFENYCLINGKKPGKYTVERYRKYLKDCKNSRKMKMRRAGWKSFQMAPYLTSVREYPITPEEAFPQINLLE
jgi:hypothetical protein